MKYFVVILFSLSIPLLSEARRGVPKTTVPTVPKAFNIPSWVQAFPQGFQRSVITAVANDNPIVRNIVEKQDALRTNLGEHGLTPNVAKKTLTALAHAAILAESEGWPEGAKQELAQTIESTGNSLSQQNLQRLEEVREKCSI